MSETEKTVMKLFKESLSNKDEISDKLIDSLMLELEKEKPNVDNLPTDCWVKEPVTISITEETIKQFKRFHFVAFVNPVKQVMEQIGEKFMSTKKKMFIHHSEDQEKWLCRKLFRSQKKIT